MFFAWLVLVPTWLIISRYFRRKLRSWQKLHKVMMIGGFGGLILIATICISIATSMGGNHMDVSRNGAHVVMGGVVIVGMMLHLIMSPITFTNYIRGNIKSLIIYQPNNSLF